MSTASHPDPALQLTTVGRGRPALILHGAPGPQSITGYVDHLAARHYVLAPTHPGWDGTSRPDWCDTVADLALTYLDLLEDRDLRDVALVGTSFGGWVAAETAVRDRGARISNLILIDAIGPHIPGQPVRAPAGPPPGGPLPPAEPGSPAAPGPARRGPSPQDMAALTAYAGASMGDPKLLRRLTRVRIPTHVLWGEKDQVVTPDFGRAYAAAFPRAHFELIKGAGHQPVRDNPEATYAAIDKFLTRGDS
ncbi:alpha/beta fold hydrolase [Streptomyces tendae]|uniref:alpha/beta fold hydrolase n=1 Tax=Streptomyces tendae TaxID=1932 RepID=UPI0037878232